MMSLTIIADRLVAVSQKREMEADRVGNTVHQKLSTWAFKAF